VSSPPILIVGAGPTGLSAAYHLGADALLVERERTVGGQCRSMAVKGFIFDQAPHVMTSNDPYVLGLYDLLLGDNVQWQDREAWVYSKSVYEEELRSARVRAPEGVKALEKRGLK